MESVSPDKILNYLQVYRDLGMLPGILLPMIEAFLPFLPLLVILIANSNAYGLWLGFLYSWLGASVGAVLVFLIVRKFGKKLDAWILKKYPSTEKAFKWIEKKGFTPIFIMSCIPFAPSFLINVISGLTTIPKRSFITAILLGKAIMIFIISFVSQDLGSLINNPWKLISIIFLIVVMWFIGKRLENKYVK